MTHQHLLLVRRRRRHQNLSFSGRVWCEMFCRTALANYSFSGSLMSYNNCCFCMQISYLPPTASHTPHDWRTVWRTKETATKQSHFSYSLNNTCLCPFSVIDENIRLDGAGAKTVCVPANVCLCNVFASAARAGQMHSDVVWTLQWYLLFLAWSRTKLEELTQAASLLEPGPGPESRLLGGFSVNYQSSVPEPVMQRDINHCWFLSDTCAALLCLLGN